jgi:putative transposase
LAGDLDGRPRSHFVVTGQVRERLAFWRGNVAALHRELVEEAEAAGGEGTEPADAATGGEAGRVTR